jgi:hypothetical protein
MSLPRQRNNWLGLLLRLVLFLLINLIHGKMFESRAAKATRLAMEQARIANEKNKIIFGGWVFDRTGFYTLVSVTIVICVSVGVQCGIWWRRRREVAFEKAKLDVVIVGNMQVNQCQDYMNHYPSLTINRFYLAQDRNGLATFDSFFGYSIS